MADGEVKILTPSGGVMTIQGVVIPPEFNLDDERYGAGGFLPILEQLKLLAQWGPLLARFQAIAVAPTPKDKALAVLDALAFAAGQTTTKIDDEAVANLEAVLKTPEGAALFNWIVTLVSVVKVVS
jgi:hypothetical protein